MDSINQNYANRLRIRASGICTKDNAILVVCHRGLVKGHDFWAPPGGGLVFGESLREGLKREFKEETGLDVKPGRFLFLNEFIRPPLHALELFFEVKIEGGDLITGIDPDLPADAQIIHDVAFKTLAELSALEYKEKHSIFHELVNFDDLYIPHHRFL